MEKNGSDMHNEIKRSMKEKTPFQVSLSLEDDNEYGLYEEHTQGQKQRNSCQKRSVAVKMQNATKKGNDNDSPLHTIFRLQYWIGKTSPD
jgi:hypothetical protein